jgi:hypothetical protein
MFVCHDLLAIQLLGGFISTLDEKVLPKLIVSAAIIP